MAKQPNEAADKHVAPEYLEQVREDMSHVLDAGEEGYPVCSSCYTEREASRNACHAANTLEELAVMMGLDEEAQQAFIASIAEYNEMCADQHDTLFGRDPETMIPFNTPPYHYFATEMCPSGNTGMASLSGLMTNADMNVLNVANKQPIEGLYAAGNSIGMAMTNGYVLGKHLASLR